MGLEPRDKRVWQADKGAGSGPLPPERKERMKFIQPKAQDATEVERSGLMRIPKRFNFAKAKEAISDGLEILARSEHPEEAKGLSGVNPTRDFGKNNNLPGKTLSEFRSAMIADESTMHDVTLYCEINDINQQEYNKNLSWSFWEKIPGMNLSVIEDNTVQGRYWVLATWPYQRPIKNDPDGKTKLVYGRNIFSIENDQIRFQTNPTHYPPSQFLEKSKEVIEDYKKIKNHFGTDTAWVVEMQLSEKDGELYFLQRHPTRPYESCSWSFKTEPQPDELVVRSNGKTLVRGSTPEEGIEAEMIYDGLANISKLPQQEIYCPIAIRDMITRQKWIARSKVFIETHATSAGESQDAHSSVIPLTKSGLYILIPDFINKIPRDTAIKIDDVEQAKRSKIKEYRAGLRKDVELGKITKEEFEEKAREHLETLDPENLVRIKMRVFADGTEARIKILDIV